MSKDLAEEFGVSASYLSRHCKPAPGVVGRRFYCCVCEARIDHRRVYCDAPRCQQEKEKREMEGTEAGRARLYFRDKICDALKIAGKAEDLIQTLVALRLSYNDCSRSTLTRVWRDELIDALAKFGVKHDARAQIASLILRETRRKETKAA